MLRIQFSPNYRISFTLLGSGGTLLGINSHLDLALDLYGEAWSKAEGKKSGKITLDGRDWAFKRTTASQNRENKER